MRRLVLVLVLAGLLAALVAVLLGRAGREEPEPYAPAAEERPAAEGAADAGVDLALAPDDGAPARTEVAAPTDGPDASKAPAAAPAAADDERAGGESSDLRGRVLWPDGRGAAGAHVALDARGTDWRAERIELPRTRADAAGGFALAPPGERPFGLLGGADEVRLVAWAEAPDGGLHAATLADPEAAPAPLEVVLAPAPAVRGRVVDTAGAPIAEGEAALTPGVGGAAGPLRRRSLPAVALEDGAFALPAPDAGTFELEVRAPGYAQTEQVVLELPHEAAVEHAVVLERLARVAGFVRTPNGGPWVGARVEVLRPDVPPWMQQLQRFGSDAGVEAGAEGRFEVPDAPPGRLELVASAERWAPSERVALELAPGEVRDGVVLTLRRGGAIAGRVLGPDGRPAPRARVAAVHAATARMENAELDDEARFELLALAPGRWQVQALLEPEEEMDPREAADRAVVEQVEVVEGETTRVTLGGARADAVRVTGRVSAAGEPVESQLVFLPDSRAGGLAGAATAESGADGAYALDLSPGSWVLQVQAADRVAHTRVVAVPEVGEHRLDVALPGGAIEGRVRRADGAPVAGVPIGLQRSDGFGGALPSSGAHARTDADGAFALEGLAPGVYDVIAGGRSLLGGMEPPRGTTHPLTTAGGVRVGPGERVTGLAITLPAAARLAGRVVDRDGRPVGGANVWLRDADGRIVERFTTLVSDPGGRFGPVLVAPGEYSLLARGAGLAAAESAPARVEAARTAAVELVAEPGFVLRVEVRPTSDAPPLAGARFELHDDGGRALHGLTGPDLFTDLLAGELTTTRPRFGPLPAGRYRCRATAPDGRVAEGETTVAPGFEAGAEVELVLTLE